MKQIDSLRILVFVFLCFCMLFLGSCKKAGEMSTQQQQEELFQPTSEFRESYAPIREALLSNDKYDIEKTVQVMYALEQLQAKAVTMDDFLSGMARMSQKGVAKEVLEQEALLLGILQEMRQIEQDAGEQRNLALYHSIINAARNTNQEINNRTAAAASMNPMALMAVVGKQAVTQTCNELEKYLDERNEQNTTIRSRIQKIEKDYINYLASYYSVCDKYMKEWDVLCIEKDRTYIDVYNGNYSSAMGIADGILAKYPTNRETLLLKALSTTMLGISTLPHDDIHLAPLSVNEILDSSDYSDKNETTSQKYFEQSRKTLEFYLAEYPNYSAPALVLQGIIALCQKEEQEGLSLLSKASIEYPRQAEKLSDMFNLYSSRSYLNKTPEGKYVLKLYRSTMEGYGIFSPNFIKAGYFTQCGRDEDSKREIFNHFFRRGNQEVYHCLLSDMQFCEQFLGGSFHRMLPENTFFDIETSGAMIGKNTIKLSFNNRTNIALQNVRVFLCLHLTDMYPNEYEIVKVPTKNIVPPMQKTNFEEVQIDYEGKNYDDIAHVRAIVMTDDTIFWVDNVDYKRIASQNGASISQPRSQEKIDRNLLLSGFDKETLQEFIFDKIKPSLFVQGANTGSLKKLTAKLTSMVSDDSEKKWINSDGKLKFEIPKQLALLAPSFALKLSTGEFIQPKVNYINESKIRLLFDYAPKNGEQCALYIYTRNVSCRIILGCVDKEMLPIKSTIF